jgi:hypothetical protein
VSEDYTWDGPVEVTHTTLERELSTAWKQVAELEAKLDAVPVDAIRMAHFGDVFTPGYIDACSTVGDWLVELAYQGVQDAG